MGYESLHSCSKIHILYTTISHQVTDDTLIYETYFAHIAIYYHDNGCWPNHAVDLSNLRATNHRQLFVGDWAPIIDSLHYWPVMVASVEVLKSGPGRTICQHQRFPVRRYFSSAVLAHDQNLILRSTKGYFTGCCSY